MSDDPFELSRRQFVEASAASIALASVVGSATARAASPSWTVPGIILERLYQGGAKVLFGVPGATCDPLFLAAANGRTKVVISSSDLEAGYTADGYARTAGLAAVSVAYGVGALALVPVIAGAWAERSPIVVINGGPSPQDLRLQKDHGTLFSHSAGFEHTDLQIFRNITAVAMRIESAADVYDGVDKAITIALQQQRPVYIEIPKNLWWANASLGQPTPTPHPEPSGEEPALATALADLLAGAKRPMVLVGIECRRFGLQADVTEFLERVKLPWVSTFLAKSVIDESTAGFCGVYAGGRSVPAVRTAVEGADAILALGCVMGRQYRRLATEFGGALLRVANGTVQIGNADPQPGSLREIMRHLQQHAKPATYSSPAVLAAHTFDERRASIPVRPASPASSSETGLRYDEVLREISVRLDENLMVITDTSLSMYPAAELNVAGRDGFLCNAVWQSIGYSVGAAIGAALGQNRRPLVICGDGGFQMTAQALSTLARYDINAVVVVLDNGLYGIEQWLLDPKWYNRSDPPRSYLGLNPWQYADLARSMGIERTWTVATFPALANALDQALRQPGPAFISVKIKPHDLPGELRT